MAKSVTTNETPAANGATTTPRKPRQRVPDDETNRDRFKRVAETRIGVVLTGLRTLGQMGNSASQYEYTEADVKKIFDKIAGSLKEAIDNMNAKGARANRKAGSLFD